MPTMILKRTGLRSTVWLLALIIVLIGPACRRYWDPIAVRPLSGSVTLGENSQLTFDLNPPLKPTRMINTVCFDPGTPFTVTLLGPAKSISDQDFFKGNPKVARDASGELIELRAELTRDDGSVIVLSEIEEWNATSICYGPVDTDEWYDMRKKRSKAVRITVRSKNELEVRRIYVESSDPWDRGK